MAFTRLSTGILSTLSLCAGIVAGMNACGDHEWSIERKGRPLPVETTTPSADVPIPWCAAFEVLNTVCQQCHQQLPINGAPFPLMTFEDTQANYPSTTVPIWAVMKRAVTNDDMPWLGPAPDGGVILPLVHPLTPSQKSTLLGWLEQGATDLGGKNCDVVYDWAAGRIPADRLGD